MITEKSQLKGHHCFRDTPPSHAKILKTAISTTAKPHTASSHMPNRKISSAPSLDHILETTATLINHTSDVGVGSTPSAISSSVSMWPYKDLGVWGWSTTCRDTTLSPALSTLLSPMVVQLSGDGQSPRFTTIQIHSSDRNLKWPLLSLNDACDSLRLSRRDINRRRLKYRASCWLAHFRVWGALSGRWYQNASKDHRNCFIPSI